MAILSIRRRPNRAAVVICGWAVTKCNTLRRARNTLFIACVSVATACQATGNPVPEEQAERPRQRGTAPESDVLTHSPLVPCTAGAVPSTTPRKALRVATWNIEAALSASLEEIATELQAMQTDIVALQEVDVRVRRTGFRDQPTVLAEALGFHHVFAASIKWDEGDYGLAVLSRWPLVEVRRHRLENPGGGEPRIVLETTVCANGRPLRLFNHHADVIARSRETGLAALRALVSPVVGQGVLVAGDFNDGPDAPGVRALIQAGLVDLGTKHNGNTGPGGRIDYLLVDPPLARLVSATRVWATRKSDHQALIADLDW